MYDTFGTCEVKEGFFCDRIIQEEENSWAGGSFKQETSHKASSGSQI